MSIGERIEQALTERGLKQADLVRMTGLKRGTISSICTGRSGDPQIGKLSLIADALGVSVDWIAGREEEPNFVSGYELRSLVSRYKKLDKGDRMAISKQIDFMLAESKKEVPDSSVSEIA